VSENAPEPGGGGGNVLTRKFGPLPGWAWLGLVVGGAAVFIYIRRKKAAAAATTPATGTTGGCTDANGNPVDCTSSAAVSDIGTTGWESLYTQQQGMESTLNNIYALLQGTQGSSTSPGGDGTGTSGPPTGGGTGGTGGTGGPLPQPGGLHLTVDGPTGVRVAWTPVPGAVGYVAQCKQGGDNGKVVNGPFDTLNAYANFGGLKPSTAYTALIWPSSAGVKGGPGTPQPHAEFEFTTKAK
jgi:hypothetical protein